MADIEVKIKLNSGVDGDKVNSVSSQYEANNVSIQKNGTAYNRLSIKNNGTNMKSWATGSLSLADGYVGGSDSVLVEQYGYNGYIFGVVPGNKEFSVTLTITGENLDSLIFYGDKEANQFPTKAYLDGDNSNLIYSDDVEWAVKFANSSSTHTITFLDWNRANYNACLTFIGTIENWLTLDKSWIKSIESLSQSTGQPKEIFYGVVPSTGSLEILDRNGEIKDYLQDGILGVKNIPINISCNNNDLLLCVSKDGEYMAEDKSLSLTLTDKFVNVLGNRYNGRKLTASTNAYDIISSLLSNMGYGNYEDMILGEKIIVSNFSDTISHQLLTVKQYLSNITIPYPYLKESTYREALEKFCTLAQLTLIKKDGSDIPVFVSARPLLEEGNNIIEIPQKNIFGNTATDIIVKNKVKSAFCGYQNIDYNFKQIGTREVHIFNSPSSSYPIVYSEYYDKYKILGKNIEIGEEVTSYNKDIQVVKTGIRDIWSVNDTSLPIYRYSIIKFTLYERPSVDLDEIKFKVNASVKFIRFNKIEEITDDVSSGEFEWEDYTSSIDLDVKDSSYSDEDVIAGWINPNNGCYLGQNLDTKVRVNDNSIDVFVAMLESLTNPSSYLILHSIYDSYSLKISVKDIAVENSVAESTTDVDIDANELIQQGTMFGGTAINKIIEDNVLFDYNNGIRTGKITVSCSNYYYSDGTIAKDWSNGQVIGVGDIICFEGNDTIWRVTGRNFRKVGVPMVDLELQEVKVIDIPSRKYTITFLERLNVYSGETKLVSGDTVDEGTMVCVKSVTSDNEWSSMTINYIKANDDNISVGQEISVNSNIDFHISITPKTAFGAYYPHFTSFTLSGNSSVAQSYTYNPNNYTVENNTITLIVGDYSQDISIPTSGVQNISLGGYSMGVEASSTEIVVRSQDTRFAGMTAEIEGTFIHNTIVE